MNAAGLGLLLISIALSATASTGFFCLEYYVELGRVIHEVTFPRGQNLTSGQLARQCNSHCAGDPECTAAWSVSAVTTAAPACKLLSHTADDVAALLQPAGRGYLIVQPPFSAKPGSKEKSLSWLCVKSQADWDELGAAAYRRVRPGAAAPGWCAYATDAAGYNLDVNWQGSSSLAACADSCDTSRQCTFWVGRPGHCWPKYSALAGADGWTSAYRPAWLDTTVQPNAAVTCFKQRQDWRELGQQLSPNAATVQYNGMQYTLFPERVNHTEADAACRRLPDGRLAQLDTQAALDVVGQALLPTLPMQYSAQVAWVGAQGILDDATASLMSGDINQLEATTAGAAAAAAAGGSTPTWQQGSGSTPVNSSLYTHPSEHYLQWRGSDRSFREYVPVRGQPVCVAALGVPPPPVAGSQPRGQASPGLYLFTCRRPTAFICQSSSLPAVLSSQLGRAVPKADLLRLAGSQDEGSSGQSKQRLALAILLPILAALVLGTASCVCASQLRWLLRSLSMQRKRAMGLPHKGSITVAVTDIQGYTKLSEAHPQAMGQALLLHNQAIRHAAYTNAGHVLAQEGDSFIVGFADPLDAAVFALQVQHSLQQLDTPPELTYEDAGALTTGSQLQSNCNGSHISSQPSSSNTNDQLSPSYLHSHRSGSAPQGLDGTEAVIGPRHSSDSPLQQPWRSSLHALLCAWSVTSSSSSSTQAVSLASGDLPQLQTPSKCSGSPAATPSSATAFRRRPSNLSGWLSSSAAGGVLRALSPHGKAGQQPGLFKGLRVRVGLATGAIRRGEAVETTMAYSMARVISDCGSGGQILADAATIQAVRSQLHLLGVVTASGLDYRLDTGRRRAAAASCLQACRPSAQPGGNRHRTSARDAVVLDMGLYETALCMLPSAGAASGLLHTPALLGGSLAQSLSVHHSVPPLQEDGCVIDVPQPTQSASYSLQQDSPWARPLSVLRRSLSVSLSGVSSVSSRALRAAASTRAHAAASGISCSSRPCACACAQVRLYQLLAPELVGRAVVFGAKLALPDSWRCIDLPYFAAPGLCDVASQGDSVPDAGQPSRANGCSVSTCRPARSPSAALAPSRSMSVAALRALSLNAPLPGTHAAANLPEHSMPPAVRFPPVAFVFVAVEGSERLQQQQFPGKGHLHALLAWLMLEACLLLRGYLVKTYELELKFFATFQTPAQAVEWCMLVQEAALLLPYDNDLLRHHGFKTKRNAQGRVVFRGPRLKMGVAAGAPTCIIPDHKGRADYLGPCCNQAARICDAAAHGGQVAMEQGVASTVLQHWRTQHFVAPCEDAAAATPDDTATQGTCPDAAAAGGPSSSSARQQSQGLSQASVPVQVTVQLLGSYLFKGCAKSLQIVHVSPQHLAGRPYPDAPPKGGKGVRLAHAAGVVEVATACLPRRVAGLELFV